MIALKRPTPTTLIPSSIVQARRSARVWSTAVRTVFLAAATVLSGPALAQDYNRTGMDVFGPFFVDPSQPRVVYLDEELELDDQSEFERVLVRYPTVETIVLNSSGGSMAAGYQIAIQAVMQGVATLIPPGGRCESACALIYFAGYPREIRGALGVHQFELAGTDAEDVQLNVARIISFLLANDVDPEVFVAMFGTPHESMYYFTQDEIDDLGLETGTIAVAVASATTIDSVRTRFLEMLTDLDSYIDTVMALASVPEAVEGPMRAFAEAVFGHPRFGDYFWSRIAPALDDNIYAVDIEAVASQTGAELPTLGMARLSQPDQLEFLAFRRDIALSLMNTDPAQCPALAGFVTGFDASQVILDYLAAQDPATIERYFGLSAAAAVAELEATEPRQTLEGERLQLTQQAFEQALVAEVFAQPNAAALADAFLGESNIPAAYCAITALMLDLPYKVDPNVRGDLILLLLSPG